MAKISKSSSKWKSQKYSKRARENRKRDNVVDIRQRRIVNFFPVLIQLDFFIKKNAAMNVCTNAAMNEVKKWRRYSSNVKMFAKYSFLVGGRTFYENL